MQAEIPLSRSRFRAALAVAALALLLALLLRWESARHEIEGIASSCRISDTWDCDTVQGSVYARVLGVPLSVWGAAGYLILIGWLVAARRKGAALLVAAGALCVFNLAVSLLLAYLSWFEVGKGCLYCTGMQLCSVALALLVVPPAWRARTVARRWSAVGLGALLAGGILFLAATGEAWASRRSELLQLLQGVEGEAVRIDTSDAIVLGNPDTPHSVLIYFDFGCPFCKECYHKAVRLAQRYPDDVHFVFKHYPLDRSCNKEGADSTQHPGACRAAVAGQAAALEGHPEEALAYLFGHQDDGFSNLVLDGLAERIGMDAARWREIRESPRAESLLQRDIAEGLLLKLSKVPEAFLDGMPIDPSRMPQRVERVVRSGSGASNEK